MGPIEVVARLRANADDMVSGFRRASNAANQFQSSVSGAGTASTRAFGMISRYAMLGAGAMQTAAMAGATMGLRTSMANEQAIISFKTLLGTQEQASAMFKELQNFAATTPFEFPQLRDAASKLLTTGVAADRVIPIMTALGDSTAAMGTGAEGIQRAVYALQQMNLAGKVTGQDMMQLANAGIPAWDALASAAGMSVAEVKKAVEKGTLQDAVPMLMSGIEQYSGAAMTRVKGMMAEQSQTLTGMMSTLKDTVNIALADMMQPAVAGIKEALPGITTLIQQTFAGLTGPINSMVQTLVTAFSQLLPTMQPIVTAFSGLMVAALTALVPLFVKFAELIPELAPAISAMAQIITDLATAFGPLIIQLADQIVPAVNFFAEGVQKVTGFLAEHQGAVEALVPVLGALVAAMVAYKAAAAVAAGIDIVSGFVKAIAMALGYTAAVEAQTAATVGATAAQTGLNTAMTLNPIGLIIALIVGLVAAFVLLWNKFEGFRNFFKTVWNGIVKGVEWAVNKILGYWEWWVNKFIDGVNLLIKGWNLIPFKDDIQELKHVNYELDLSAALLSTAGKQAVTSAGQFRMFEEQMNKVAFAADTANKSVAKLGGDRGFEMLQKSKPSTSAGGGGGLAKGMTAAEKAAAKLKATMKDLREQIKQTYEDGIAAAQQKLQDLKDAQNDYALSVSSGITGQVTLGTALSTVTDAIQKQQTAYDQFLNVVSDVITNAVSFNKVLEDQKSAADALTSATTKQSEAESTMAAAQAEVDAITRKLNATRNRGRRLEYQKELIEANKKLADAEAELGTATKGVSTAQEQADKVGTGFVSGLEKQVRAAQAFAQQLGDLKKLGLNEAAMRQVMSAGAEAGGKIATELLAGGVETVAKTNSLIDELDTTAKNTSSALAGEYYKVGQLTAGSLLDAMDAQTKRATTFADNIKTLVAMGLSQENLTAVINAGAVAGYDIADALVKGGNSTVASANLMQDNLKTAADAAGKEAAKKYYDLGVTLATQIVDGLIAEWNRVKPTLPNMTLPELQKTLTNAQNSVEATGKALDNLTKTPDIVSGGGGTSTPAATPMNEYVAAAYMALGSPASADAFRAVSTPAVTRATIVDQFLDIVNRQFGKSWQTLSGYFNATGVKGMASTSARKDRWEAFAKANGVPAFGKGGIVMGPQLALIGEAGPEAVIPLNRLNSGGSQYNIVVNAGMGTDGAEVGRQIVTALREYERRNGKLPISTRR